MNVHDDMRGQRLGEAPFEKGDHRAEDTRWDSREKGKFGFWISGLLGCVLAFLSIFAPARAEEAAPAIKWRILLEPKSMHREVDWKIPNAQRTVMAAVMEEREDYVYPSPKKLEELEVKLATIQETAAKTAADDLATLTPRYQRNKKQVIQYAELHSERPIVASAVLSPKLLDLFQDTLGEKVLLVVPNRFTAYVFPSLASNYQEYWPMIFEAFRATAWPVSVEVFEVSGNGLRAVGVYQEP